MTYISTILTYPYDQNKQTNIHTWYYIHTCRGAFKRGREAFAPLEQIWPPLEHTGFTPVSNTM